MMKLFFKSIKYKACKYFVRKNTGNNLFGKLTEQYGKTKLTKEELINKEKKLDIIKNHTSNPLNQDMEKLIQEGILNGKSESQILKEMLQEELPQIEKNLDNKYLDDFLKDDYKIFDSLKGLKAEQRNKTSIDPKSLDINQDIITSEELKKIKDLKGNKNLDIKDNNIKNYQIKIEKPIEDEQDNFSEEFYKSFRNNDKLSSNKSIKINDDSDNDNDNQSNTRLVIKSDIDNLPEDELDKVFKKQNSLEAQQKFVELLKKDIDTFRYEKEKENAISMDATKMSRVSPNNILDVKKTKDDVLKKRALHLANLWHLNLAHTKYWFYRLKREERVIVKAMLRLRKLEMKRKLKKLSKQWKIENDDILEIDYIKEDNKDKEKLDIPKHYKSIDEFIFFGDDVEFMIHYKRTCSNIHKALNEFFSSNKQTIKRGIGKDLDVVISDIKMNKACTVIYAWWEVPLNIMDENENLIPDEVLKKIELNLNQSIPYIRGFLTRQIRLKYAPEIRFVKDNIVKDYEEFEKYIEEVKVEKDKNIMSNLDNSISKKDIYYFSQIPFNKEEMLQYAENLRNDVEKEKLKKILLNTQVNNLYDYFKSISNNGSELKKFLTLYKENLKIKDENIPEPNQKDLKKMEKQKKTKSAIKAEKAKEKIYKQFKLGKDNNDDDQKLDYQEIYFNYVNNYDRKIPNNRSFGGINIQEAKLNSEKLENREDIISKKFRNNVKNIVNTSEKLIKPKRNKSEEFWKNLENMY